jgi:hypothetical protein
MRHDLDELKENERQLDALIETMKEASKRQNQEARYAYVTCNDLHNIDMYKEEMIMVVKAPSESQLILMDGDPPPVVLKSEKDEIDIFFCPSGNGSLHPAAPDTSSDDDEIPQPSTSSAARRSTSSSNKKRNLGSAQRNLSKAFDEMTPTKSNNKNNKHNNSKNGASTAKSNLFNAFNATVKREESSDDDELDEEDEHSSTEDEIPKSFRASAIKPQTDLMLNEQTEEADALDIKKDVKLSIFSPQKSTGSAQKWEMPELEHLSPSFFLGASDDRFFPLEPEAEYNFMLSDTEGIADLFDYKI